MNVATLAPPHGWRALSQGMVGEDVMGSGIKEILQEVGSKLQAVLQVQGPTRKQEPGAHIPSSQAAPRPSPQLLFFLLNTQSLVRCGPLPEERGVALP